MRKGAAKQQCHGGSKGARSFHLTSHIGAAKDLARASASLGSPVPSGPANVCGSKKLEHFQAEWALRPAAGKPHADRAAARPEGDCYTIGP